MCCRFVRAMRRPISVYERLELCWLMAGDAAAVEAEAISVTPAPGGRRLRARWSQCRGQLRHGSNVGGEGLGDERQHPPHVPEFDLASLGGDVQSVAFSCGFELRATPASLAAFGVADTSWGETSVNWNNKPPLVGAAGHPNRFGHD